MTIINLTPHGVTVIRWDGSVLREFPALGGEARLKTETVPSEPIEGIPTTKTVFGEVTGLPGYEEGVYYIVSQLVKNALPIRADLLVPAEVIRDSRGVILGCKSLGR